MKKTQTEILNFLRSSGGGYISSREISLRLGISRAAVWKQVQNLRWKGYRISAFPKRGYRLDWEPDCLRPEELALPGIIYQPVVDSTNKEAKRLAEEGQPGGTTIVAEEQTAGRGRRGRSWASLPGKGLWFSLLLRPVGLIPARSSSLTLVVAVAAAQALADKTGVNPGIKWPNDLLVKGRKIAGILTEIKGEPDCVEYLVVGMGINVNHSEDDFPPELCSKAGSLLLAAGRPFDRTHLFLELRKRILEACEQFFREGFAPFRQRWIKHSVNLGRPVTVTWPGGSLEGLARDLDDDGALVVEDRRGRIHVLHYGELDNCPGG